MGTSKSNSNARASRSRLAIAVCALVFISYVGFELWSAYSETRRAERQKSLAQQKSEATVEALVASEELLLELTPLLRTLSRSAENLQLPDRFSVDMFADEVAVSGVAAKSTSRSGGGWGIAKKSELVTKSSLSLWDSVFSSVAWIEQAKFFFVNGELDSRSSGKFRTSIGFTGILNFSDGQVESIDAKLKVEWEKVGVDSAARWVISSWQLTELNSLGSPTKLFENVLSKVVEDRETYVRATLSKHTALTSHLMHGKEYNFPPGETYPLFFPDVTLEHPGVSVVDIDNDGFEDFYVAMQHDANLLFRNKGDGTFEEVASRYGLDIRGDSTSAIFADFDNDGDQDLFLGRARRKSMYLVNEGGVFFDRTAECVEGSHLPALVSSVSATDYDNDGLLDVYVCTYSPIEESNRFHVANKPMWVGLFLNEAEGEEVMRRNRSSHRFIDRAGPPNVLLRNLGGGKFAVAKENAQLQLWRMSFQAAWNDFDNDGDQDVYVANDYASDNFFRNDGPNGFTDITEEVGITGMGFGMGVSWGDYDNDGQTDAFVTNMYSKAGRRITEQISGVDPRIREMAEGNFLYRLDNGKFKLVSGEGGLKVAKSGWSWGGQFFDFDNDGYRDIYATSGYYTAPADVAEETDL